MKTRSKILMTTLTLILIFSTFTASADILDISADNETMAVCEIRGGYRDESHPIYIGEFYDEYSKNGYTEEIKDGLKCLMRVREIKRIGVGEYLYNSKHLVDLYRGQSQSLTETKTDSKTTSVTEGVSVTGTYSIGLVQFGPRAKISIETSLQKEKRWTNTYTFSTTDVFTFPEDVPSEYSYVSIYSGFTHDNYKSVVDYVPYEEFEKNTEIRDCYLTIPGPWNEGEGSEYDIWLELADGRRVSYYNGYVPYRILYQYSDIRDVPFVKMRLDAAKEMDYYTEYTYGYNYDNREVLEHDVVIPIPSIRWEPHN